MASKAGGLRALGRVLREAMAIFIGVAAALGGQAWFEARVERDAEREYLERVARQLTSTEETVSSLVEFSTGRQRRMVMVAELLSQPATATVTDSLAAIAPRLSYYANPDELDATVLTLSPESLRLVRDPELEETLGSLALQVRGVQGVLAQQRDFLFGEWRSFGIEYFDYRRSGFFSDWPEYSFQSRHPRGGQAIAESPRFENLLDLSFMQSRNARLRAEVLTAEIARAQEQITSRLAAL